MKARSSGPEESGGSVGQIGMLLLASMTPMLKRSLLLNSQLSGPSHLPGRRASWPHTRIYDLAKQWSSRRAVIVGFSLQSNLLSAAVLHDFSWSSSPYLLFANKSRHLKASVTTVPKGHIISTLLTTSLAQTPADLATVLNTTEGTSTISQIISTVPGFLEAIAGKTKSLSLPQMIRLSLKY